MKHPTSSHAIRILSIVAAPALAGAAAALLVVPASAATVSVPPPAPPAVTMTVSAPYNDLSSTVCDGQVASAVARIQSTDGFVKDFYAFAGDTVELVGLAKACQWRAAPTDALEWGFQPTDVTWTSTDKAGAVTDLGPGRILQSGPDAVPTTSLLTHTFTAGDDGGKLVFGNPSSVASPNGQDVVLAATTVFLHVLDPRLMLVKEVCVTGTGCDIGDWTDWRAAGEIAAGTDVEWRLTARNPGTVTLRDVSVRSDGLSGGTTTGNGCSGASVVASLPPGTSASIVCTTTGIRAEGDGDVVNTAELTSTFTDPTGTGRLVARYVDGVLSGPADASVHVVPAPVTTPAPVPVPTDPPATGEDDADAGGVGGAAAPGTAPAPGAGGQGRASGSDRADALAQTGSDAGPALAPALAALGLCATGAAVVLRRRRAARR